MEGAGVENARTADTGDGQGQTQGRDECTKDLFWCTVQLLKFLL